MALLSEEEKEQLNRVLAEYPNSEDLEDVYKRQGLRNWG